MTKADEVASYLKNRVGDATAIQLQKLIYYSQGCHLALHGQPLFDEPIEAWKRGPAVRRVFQLFRGRRKIPTSWFGASHRTSAEHDLSDEAKRILDVVADTLGDMDPDDLVESTHQESPWQTARGDIPEDARSQEVIKHDEMQVFFERICLPQAREPDPDELSPAALELFVAFANRRAFTPPTVSAEHADAWQARLDAPPRELPGLRQFLLSTRERTEA